MRYIKFKFTAEDIILFKRFLKRRNKNITAKECLTFWVNERLNKI